MTLMPIPQIDSLIALDLEPIDRQPSGRDQVVYRLNFEIGSDTQMKITLQSWLGSILRREVVGTIAEWSHKVSELSSYMAVVYRLSSESTKTQQTVNVENVASYIGRQLWELIHHSLELLSSWKQFIKDVTEHPELPRCICIVGENYLVSVPLECFISTEPWILLHHYNVPVIRKNSVHIVKASEPYMLDLPLPTEVIVLLGNDPRALDGKSIDYHGEIRSWYQMLQPDKEILDEEVDSCVFCGGEIQSNEHLQHCNIIIVPKGNLKNLRSAVSGKVQPFLFVYIGHGNYLNYANHRDGHLAIESDSSQHRMGDPNDQEVLADILSDVNTAGVLLNCCEGLRNLEFTSAGGVEDYYFGKIPSLKILMGFRSKVMDVNAQLISQQLIQSILAGHSLLEFLSEVVKVEGVVRYNDDYMKDKAFRDRISRVSLLA